MDIKHLLSPERVRYCPDALSRKRLLEMVSELLCQELSDVDYLDLFEDFIEREELGSTAMGHGVAIPHIRSSEVNEPRAALLHLEQGVDYDAPDDKKVDLIIALMVPKDDDNTHLQILAQCARCFNQPNFRQVLRNARSDNALFDALCHHDCTSTEQ